MRGFQRFLCVVIALTGGSLLGLPAQSITVTGSVSIRPGADRTGKLSNSNAVIWLKPAVPVNRQASLAPSSARPRFKILQKNKRFDPHVLAVPAGAIIDFPNLDPFFHNVFSMFDGKRFDLGLYESGASHAVTFDTPGVCYIFCNIHPEMSAAVVVVDSLYYATSGPAGEFSIRNVPEGTYLLYVWHERGKPESPSPQEVTITAERTSVGTIRLMDAGEILADHKNKYGKDYDRDKSPGPYK